jgi:hypothetical protein
VTGAPPSLEQARWQEATSSTRRNCLAAARRLTQRGLARLIWHSQEIVAKVEKGGGVLPGDGDVDVESEHAGEQGGGKFGGELA